jgi:hypothetical protein
MYGRQSYRYRREVTLNVQVKSPHPAAGRHRACRSLRDMVDKWGAAFEALCILLLLTHVMLFIVPANPVNVPNAKVATVITSLRLHGQVGPHVLCVVGCVHASHTHQGRALLRPGWRWLRLIPTSMVFAGCAISACYL